MSSSAITGNTSGIATATSPGLVGTGAQTFAGKKTLDGGALIKSDTTGTAIPANYIGEAVYLSFGFLNLTSNAWASLGTITLHAGIWMVSCNLNWIRNTATIGSSLEVAAAVGSTTTDISTNFVTKYLRRSASDNYNSSAAATFASACISIPSFYVRSDGTNLYFVDGTTLVSSSQVLTLACFTSTFTGGPCQATGTLTAVLIG